jgi:hypothetical protein
VKSSKNNNNLFNLASYIKRYLNEEEKIDGDNKYAHGAK